MAKLETWANYACTEDGLALWQHYQGGRTDVNRPTLEEALDGLLGRADGRMGERMELLPVVVITPDVDNEIIRLFDAENVGEKFRESCMATKLESCDAKAIDEANELIVMSPWRRGSEILHAMRIPDGDWEALSFCVGIGELPSLAATLLNMRIIVRPCMYEYIDNFIDDRGANAIAKLSLGKP